jgi:outer membrane lipoprotein SlyB
MTTGQSVTEEKDVSTAEAAKLPIMKIAAGAVIVLCAVGIGVLTGLIPGVSSQDKSAAPAQTPAAAVTAESGGTPNVGAPAKQAAVKPVAKKHARVSAPAPAPARVAAAEPIKQEKALPPVCHECGVVESVNAVEVKGQSSGAGAVAGGIAGLILGNQIGQKNGRTLAKIAGAAGGAYLGNEIEKNAKKAVQYQVAVRMDDGTERTITQTSDAGLTAGTRVKIVDGAIVRN